MKKLTTIAVVGLLVIGFALALVGGITPLDINSGVADVVGKGLHVNGVLGGSVAMQSPAGDLLDSIDYVTSFTPGGTSEKIVITPSFLNYGFPWGDGPMYVHMDNYWIVLSFSKAVIVNYYGKISDKVTSFETNHLDIPAFIPTGKEWLTMPSIIIKLTGPVTGVIHVDLWVHHRWNGGFGGLQKLSADDIVASDEARLMSGIGAVSVPSYTETGKDLVLTVTAEYSHSDTNGGDGPGGWTLQLFNNVGIQVKSWDIADHVSGYVVKYKIPDDAFSSVVGTNNNWLVEMWNNLFRTDVKYTVIIKQGTAGMIPPAPSIEPSADLGKPPYPAGKSLQWLVIGEKNPKGLPLAGFRVSVQYSNTNDQMGAFVMQNQWFDAVPSADNKSWYCDVAFTADQQGYYVITAQSVDSQNNPSVFGKLKIEAGPPHIDDNKNGGPSSQLLGIALIVVGVVVIILAGLTFYYAPKPWAFIIGLILIAAAILLITYGFTIAGG